MISREEFLNAVEIIKEYKKQLQKDEQLSKQSLNFPKSFYVTQKTKIIDAELSMRLFNVIKVNHKLLDLKGDFEDMVVRDLQLITINNLRKCKNVGSKTITEFYAVLKRAGLEVKP